ncbi:MAG: hypothetical protein OEZ06_32585 [Myxococcales bacterium]|nr:hypothetical protein [Myxococcales bacterium]
MRRSHRTWGLCYSLLASGLGCESIERAPVRCDDPIGEFAPLYDELEGDCGPIESSIDLSLMSPDSQITVLQRRASGTFFTEAHRSGCEIELFNTQLDHEGTVVQVAEIQGRLLDDSTRIEGLATISRFDRKGQLVCQGEYDANLQRQP